MNLTISFSYIGIVVFALPMIINIFYAVFPPTDNEVSSDRKDGASASSSEALPKTGRLIETVEQISRIAYLITLTFLKSKDSLCFKSFLLYISVVFLVLYYAVWIRYFASGRKIEYLRRSFLLIPIPLAVFPVLYFIFAAVWMHNLPAAIIAGIFGAAHITVSIRSFRNERSS